MAHSIWKEIITLFLKGCRNCWSYKVLKFVFEANITKFQPDNAYFSKHMLDAICTFTFDEVLVKKYIDMLYLNRFSNYVGICPKTAPSNGLLFANTLIGPAYLVHFVTRISIISTFTCS